MENLFFSNMKKSFIACVLLITFACVRIDPIVADTLPVSHASWDALLKKHVDDKGNVNYKGFISDSTSLNKYIGYLAKNGPNNNEWSGDEKLAYYINLYNAATIQLIIRHYPIESIKDIGSKIQIPFINTPWQVKFIKIGIEDYNLDNIEHNIIRKGYDEPRIHFALVCAAVSCPRLRNEAYLAEKLDDQLTDQARKFLSHTGKNKISKNELEISKIFQWFTGDFTKKGKIQEFLNQYTEVEISPDADIKYMDYNWALNDK